MELQQWLKELNINLGLELEDIKELSAVFLSDMVRLLEKLEGLDIRNNHKEACRMIHSIKGAAATFEVVVLTRHARSLEVKFLAHDYSDIDQDMRYLRYLINQLKEFLIAENLI